MTGTGLPTPVNPCELFAEIADRITAVVKQPYRASPVTQAEWDTIRDSIITMDIGKEKANGNTGG